MRRGVVNKFNRGEMDPRAFFRDDVDKVNNSCELIENFIPQRLGPMQYRPGTKYVDTLAVANSRLLPFISSTLAPALLAINAYGVNVYISDSPVVEIPGTISIVNPSFESSIAGWTDSSGPGAAAVWDGGGAAMLNSGFDSAAKLWQTAAGGVGVAQHVVVIVDEAPITFKIGESGFDSGEIFHGILEPGYHSFRFTPTSAPPTFTLINNARVRAMVRQVAVGTGTEMFLPMWGELISNLSSIRVTQSADVMFVARDNGPPFKIQRWSNNSWSLVGYRADDGPFGLVNNTDITLTPSTVAGNGTLTASANLFTPEDVGRLYKLTSASQIIGAQVTKDNSGLSNNLRVTGVGPIRTFKIAISGSFSAKVWLQRSPDETSWRTFETLLGSP